MRRARLETLVCYKTEDWLGRDECRLAITHDGASVPSMRHKMRRKDTWNLAQLYEYEHQLEVKLWDEDWPDADDFLGSVVIDTGLQPEAEAWFTRDDARYKLTYRVGPVLNLSASVGQGGSNQQADVLAVKRRLIELGFDWLTENGQMDQATIRAIKLFQSIVAGREKVQGDGRIDVPGQTYSWLRAFNAPRWQLMPLGAPSQGFVNYEATDLVDKHDYGTDWLASTIEHAGAAYYRDFLSSHSGKTPITLNDASLPQGGDTPDHTGHETGLGCDLRLPYPNGQSGGDAGQLDLDAMRAMLTAIKATPLWKCTLFDNATLIGEGLCEWADEHKDHAHVGINPPERID